MHERLVESWLDSASERSYQAPFCQMLAADGHRIVHSTRHSPIELGKDVITVDANDAPCAYQLKGHPGGRLTLQGLREIQPQLHELTSLAIPFPELRHVHHRSFLVTNGLVEEEATLAIEQMNAANETDGYPERRLEVIQRGDLLAMASRLGHSLWPTEIQQTHLLLEMLVERGDGLYEFERANRMLRAILGLEAGARPNWSAAEVRRRITSAAILVSLSLKNYDARQNHFASISAWVQFSAAAIAACERFQISFERNARAAVDIALIGIRDALIDLAREALERDPPLVEGDVMLDAAFYRARYTLVLGLLSLLWFWCEEEGWPDDLAREELEAFLHEGRAQLYLWGEAAIPQILAYYWFWRRTESGGRVDGLLLQLLTATVETTANKEPKGLPSPYWSFEDVTRHALAPILGFDQDPMAEETTGRMSFFAESLLHLLVRTNWKQVCRQVWPDVSRIQFVEFRPRSRWEYCLSFSEHGRYRQVQPPMRKEWSDLIEEARSIRCEQAPEPLIGRPMLHALFVVLFPYRASPEVVRTLSRAFNRAWLIPPPVDA